MPFDFSRELVMVLGYDASDASQRALEHVAMSASGQPARIQVVNVVDDDQAEGPHTDLAARVQRSFAGTGADWRFEWRNGILATELLAAADALQTEDDRRSIVIVVGRPGSQHPDVADSVLADLFHLSRYPVLMVP